MVRKMTKKQKAEWDRKVTNRRIKARNQVLKTGFLENDEAMTLIAHLTSCDNPKHKERQGVNFDMVKINPIRKISKETDQKMRQIVLPERAKSTQWSKDFKPLPNNNSKLGKSWAYVAFESAWECSGIECQCENICYAKHMEITYKNKTKYLWQQFLWWCMTSNEDRADIISKWIMSKYAKKPRNGIRFCDTGDVPDQRTLDEIFETVRLTCEILAAHSFDTRGRFYIYSTRHDLDWSNKPTELVLNASNDTLFRMVPGANRFKAVRSFDEIPAGAYICSCNCKACDYCSKLNGEVIYEIMR